MVGTQGSGKSVFLTSLISHMKEHDPKLMPLQHDGKGFRLQFGRRKHLRNGQMEILELERLDPAGKEFQEFKYEHHRTTLAHDRDWPDKTKDVSVYRCDIRLDTGKTYALEFLDFPGERTADFLMVEAKDFGEWSDRLLKRFDADVRYRSLVQVFLKVAEAADAEEIVHSYKVFLGEAVSRHYSRLVTPSTFLLDAEGTKPQRPVSPERWATERYCGLGPESQFTPLPAQVREAHPELAELFGKRFAGYRDEKVVSLVTWLKDADRMLLLLDIPTILMGGAALYNDELSIAKTTLSIANPEASFWRGLKRLLSLGLLWQAKLEKVGVVATKSDLVSSTGDIDNMLQLARSMTRKKLKALNLEPEDYDFFACAAVKSTRRTDQKGMLQGKPISYDNDGVALPRTGAKLREFEVSAVPAEWPPDGEWNGFKFPDVYPQVSARADEPPPQEGLGDILMHLLDLRRK